MIVTIPPALLVVCLRPGSAPYNLYLCTVHPVQCVILAEKKGGYVQEGLCHMREEVSWVKS